MKPPIQWATEINSREEYRDDITLSRMIERIQSDARAAAIEECAALCEDQIGHNYEVNDGVALCIDAIRALAEAGAKP
jgi:hypothetical protein